MKRMVHILGNKINCFNSIDELYEYLISNLTKDIPNKYVTVNNVHTVIEGYRDKTFQSIINNGFLSLPDGKPLEFVGRLKGEGSIKRLFGPSIMEAIIDKGRSDKISHFFLGSSAETLEKLKRSIEIQYPGTIIVGMISPPFLPFDKWKNENYIDIINLHKPDFIWIGLGAPRQERWMSQFCTKINRGFIFGIGAGFDYLAGNTKHAPVWMKESSLEWLFRLCQEPRRLYKRYFNIIPPFLFFASLEILKERFKSFKKFH